MNKKIMTLCIIHQKDRVLLGMKKCGFGVGNWNGFGGKVNDVETIEDVAKRELVEECGLIAKNLDKIGVLDFSWKGKDDVLEVNIFKVTDFLGTVTESEEMKPQWFSLSKIPFEKMWSDDKYWLPLFLEDKKFKGRFVFDDKNNVLEYELS